MVVMALSLSDRKACVKFSNVCVRFTHFGNYQQSKIQKSGKIRLARFTLQGNIHETK